MSREMAFAGVLFPGLLLVFLGCLALLWLLDWFAGRHGWYRHVWHPALFRLALFASIFGGLGLLLMR